MKRKHKAPILPSKRLVLNIINEATGVDEEVLNFYESYIQEMATHPVHAPDGSRTGFFYDEDLAQELRFALCRSLPSLRKMLLKEFFSKKIVVFLLSERK